GLLGENEKALAGLSEGILVVYRSAAKPFQAIPLVEDGVVDHFGLPPDELALAAASHNGEPRHLAGVTRILRRVGCVEEDLGLGPLLPLGPEAATALLRSGDPVRPIHNNCSGQHAALLGLARIHDWPLPSYLEAGHPLQRRMLAEMERFTGLKGTAIHTMVDGCGMVAFGVPLRSMALSFARLGAAAREEDGPRRILEAMAGHPFMLGGTGRLCTRLPEVTGGRLIGKLGAEGVYGITIPGEGLGFALKVEDGGMRAGDPAVLRALETLGLLGPEESEALHAFRRPELRNSRGEVVGEMRGTFSFQGGSEG
ncbi:MAG: asparaginase, partial [Longimicrobiales bacterium]